MFLYSLNGSVIIFRSENVESRGVWNDQTTTDPSRIEKREKTEILMEKTSVTQW